MAIEKNPVPSRMNTLARVSQTQPKTVTGSSRTPSPLTPRGEAMQGTTNERPYDEGETDPKPQAWPGPSPLEMELKHTHFRMDMANKHRRPSTQPLVALKQRKLVVKCEYGQQLYTLYTFLDGGSPVCPECGAYMQTISEIGE